MSGKVLKVPVQTQTPASNDDVVQRIGNLVRMLRDSMRELGLDKEVEKAAKAIPDARDRLSYIGTMTEQAAERALNAIDRAQPLQSELSSRATGLEQRWQDWFEKPVELAQARELALDTREYLAAVPGLTESTNKELLEIMMAQDFQDLTGQVIKKMIDVVRGLEFQLLQVLLDNVPDGGGRGDLQRRVDELKGAEVRREASLLNGPQIKAGEPDVINSQDQVDDLLADLGF
ncbi:MAG: protein phosphatase CheZ [Pseudomonadales bacterium]|nr:protein phosphatase CheZ [Pseudomonadales bacterium]